MFRVLPAYIFDKEAGLREKLRLAKVGNFEGIDIDIEEIYNLIKEHSPAYVKGMIDSFNLRAGAWRLPFSLNADQKIYEKSLEKLEEYARVASYLEAFRVITFFADNTELKKDINFYEGRIKRVLEVLSEYGCILGIGVENDRYFISPDLTRLLKKLKSENAGFVFSARLWHLSGGEEDALRRVPGNEIVYVSVSDVSPENKGIYLPGETGTINLQLFFNVLSDIGYDGPVSPEMPERDILAIPSEIAVRLLGGALLKIWQKVITEK